MSGADVERRWRTRHRGTFDRRARIHRQRIVERVTPDGFQAAVDQARAHGADIPDTVDLEAVRKLRPGEDFTIEASNTWLLQSLLKSVDIVAPLLNQREWMLINAGPSDFLTSGRPVSLDWTEPRAPGFYPPAFGVSGTDVLFPLSKKLAMLRRFESTTAGRRARAATRDEVAALNARTARHAVRFICWPKGSADVSIVSDDNGIRHVSELAAQRAARGES